MNIIGPQGLQLFVDFGQPIDQDLIEVLAREVLEEKIASMLSGGSKEEYSSKEEANEASKNPFKQPQPSVLPRKNTEFVDESKMRRQESLVYDVQTPDVTPNISPPISPRRPITPQVSVEKEKEVRQVTPPPPIQAPQPPTPLQQYPIQIIPFLDSDGSILEETLKEEYDEDDQRKLKN